MKAIKYVIVIVLVLVILGGCAVAGLYLMNRFVLAEPDEVERAALSAIIKDGIAYFALETGEVIKVEPDADTAIRSGYITPDRTKIVYLMKNHCLYVSDIAQTQRHLVTDNCTRVNRYVTDDAFSYDDGDEEQHEMIFEGISVREAQDSDKTEAFFYIENDCVYSKVKGESTLLFKDDGLSNGSMGEGYISEDGQFLAFIFTPYTEQQDEFDFFGKVPKKVYVYNYGEVYEFEDGSYDIIESKDAKFLILVSSKELYIIRAGEEPLKVNMGSWLTSKVYTDCESLYKMNADEIDAFYIRALYDNEDRTPVLYRVLLNGEREKITMLDNVSDIAIRNNRIIWIDENDNLCCGKIKNGVISDALTITHDQSSFTATDDYEYIYFKKDEGTGKLSLYCYKFGDSSPIKITGDIIDGYTTASDYIISDDGSSVYYYLDVAVPSEDIFSSENGTLMKWSYKTKESVKIADEVLTSQPDDLSRKCFLIKKYSHIEDNKIVFTLWHYNGEEVNKIA